MFLKYLRLTKDLTPVVIPLEFNKCMKKLESFRYWNELLDIECGKILFLSFLSTLTGIGE